MVIGIAPEMKDKERELRYILRIMGNNLGHHFDTSVDTKDEGMPNIGQSEDSVITISSDFASNNLSIERLGDDSLFHLPNGKPDYLSTAFFMLASQQEYTNNDKDSLGRFKFENSYQFKYNNTKDNIVQFCFNQLAKQLKLKERLEKSSIFLTHDIDDVYGAILEDGYNALKRGRIDQMLKLLFNAMIGNPDWLNMDKIMKLESAYDCRSTFFWIVNKGRLNKREKNADYEFSSPVIQRHFRNVEKAGFENGIHKSISKESFQEEIEKYGRKPLANRYHYLKFSLPNGFDEIQNAGLQIDTSLV